MIKYEGKLLRWGKGAVAGDFVFLSGAEARADDTDVPPRYQSSDRTRIDQVEERLKEGGVSMENIVKFVWCLTTRADGKAFYEAGRGRMHAMHSW